MDNRTGEAGPVDFRVARAILASLRNVPIEALEADPEVDQREIAALINRPKSTVEIMKSRSRPEYQGPGKLAAPMPEPTGEIPASATGGLARPLWLLSVILPWLAETQRWYRLLDRAA